MQLKIIALFLAGTAGLALATPVDTENRHDHAPYKPCPDTLYSVAQCCDTSGVKLANLACSTPKDSESPEAFKKSCAESEKSAKCCTADLHGRVDLVCTGPTGIN